MQRDPHDSEKQALEEILGPSAGDVLEIGCGDGRLTGVLLGISPRITGLDPDAGSIDQARHLHENRVRFILGSGEDIPLTDNCIDTVVFSLSLHHHDDPDNALAQARRILKRQGRILILEPETISPVNVLFRFINNEDEAYDRAASAVHTCGLDLEDLGSYSTIWRFADFGEMVDELFGYFDMESDPERTEAMAQYLGDRCKLQPLDIEDTTRYWLLQEVPGEVQISRP
jgi:SAM-dependent methyltransferase